MNNNFWYARRASLQISRWTCIHSHRPVRDWLGPLQNLLMPATVAPTSEAWAKDTPEGKLAKDTPKEAKLSKEELTAQKTTETIEKLKQAKKDYTDIFGKDGDIGEITAFLSHTQKAANEAEAMFNFADDAEKMKKMKTLCCGDRYPYEHWDAAPACCVCPPCAACPLVFTCPWKVPCFPCAICGICVRPPCGLPRFNPCCKATILCKPLCDNLANPICILHPKCCCSFSCCSGSGSCACCKVVGFETPCCHCTFTKCPICCPNVCCVNEVITEIKHVEKKSNSGAPDDSEMER